MARRLKTVGGESRTTTFGENDDKPFVVESGRPIIVGRGARRVTALSKYHFSLGGEVLIL